MNSTPQTGRETYQRLLRNLETVIQGQQRTLRKLLADCEYFATATTSLLGCDLIPKAFRRLTVRH